MKIFLCFFLITLAVQAKNAYAMFAKTDTQMFGRPKFSKPLVGTIYAGAGAGVPMYGITNISGADYGSAAGNTAVQNSVHAQTDNLDITTLPMINGYIGYLQLSLPLRHEIGFTFLSNSFNVSNNTISINNQNYKNSTNVMQNYFLTYAIYFYHSLKNYPISLFIGGGGGLALFNSIFSDGGTSSTTAGVTTTTISTPIKSVTAGGVINFGTGFTYRIMDDMAFQVKVSYYLVSSPFNSNVSSFPFMHVLSFNLDMFFKVI